MTGKSMPVNNDKRAGDSGKATATEQTKGKLPDDFAIKDCALLSMTTGRHAQDLRELELHLKDVHRGCIYHHFWGNRMRPRFELPEFQNDFAAWARNALHDHPLSERLGIINPSRVSNLEVLRNEVIDVIEERLAEREMAPAAQRGQEFTFIRSQTVVFDTHIRIHDPQQLCAIIPNMSLGSVYYHIIDARRRIYEGLDDFSSWLRGFGDEYKELIEMFNNLDPYFMSLTELRERVANVCTGYFHG